MTVSASPIRRARVRRIVIIAVLIVATMVTATLIRTYVMRTFSIPSDSMTPTIESGERVTVSGPLLGGSTITRGDIVVFTDPGGWLPSDAMGMDGHLIKRVIGVGGDHVVCCDTSGRLTVNGNALDEPYLEPSGPDARASSGDFDIIVPSDSLWVMGDNRRHSTDSRILLDGGNGFVPSENVTGRAFAVVWPLSSWRFLDRQ